MFDIDNYLTLIQSEKMRRSLKIQNQILSSSGEFLRQKQFVEILPVVISPITDPLTDYRVRGEIECYGFKYQITKSMIFHKQIALLSQPRIFCFSPNVRIEPRERQKSGKHLIEFVQLDLEVKDAAREEVMKLGEELLIYVLEEVKKLCASDLEFFQRDLKIPKVPFKKICCKEAISLYGEGYEIKLSERISEPIWVLDFPIEIREFYDKEYPEQPGILNDMDLVYPEGFGEALSGGEREFELEKVKRRIEQKNIDLKAYDLYLQFIRKGIFPSAGFGLGIERMTRFICGLREIKETRLFAKLPGELGL